MRKRVQAFHIFPHSQNKRVGIDQKKHVCRSLPYSYTYTLGGGGRGGCLAYFECIFLSRRVNVFHPRAS